MSEGGPVEDAWQSADWVMSVSDPAIEIERINALFHSVIFATVPDDDQDETAVAPRHKLLRKKELEDDDDLKNARRELDGEDLEGDEEDEGDIIDFEKISENEEAEMDREGDGMDSEARDFQRWIGQDQSDGDEPEAPEQDDASPEAQLNSIRAALERVGLDRSEALAPVPERLQELLRKKSGSGPNVSLNRTTEAAWILMHLASPGQALATNSSVVLKFRKMKVTAEDLRRNPLVKAVRSMLKLMLDEHLEPGYLMIYHKYDLEPILEALWTAGEDEKQFSTKIELAHAYCTGTGRRERPKFCGSSVYFESISQKTKEEENPAWLGKGQRYVCRRPACIDLGHILVDILELDQKCHQLEISRQAQLEALRAKGDPLSAAAASILEGILFVNAVEADIWKQYTAHLARGPAPTGRYTQEMERKKLTQYFSDFCIHPEHYHENLSHEKAIHSSLNSHSLKKWKEQVARDTGIDADKVIDLFLNAIVEQFSVLPLLRKLVLNHMQEYCNLVVQHTDSGRREQCSVATILTENPRAVLNLLEDESNRKITISYHLDEKELVSRLNANNMFTCAEPNSDWDDVLRNALFNLGVRVAEREVKHLTNLLRSSAEAAVKNHCVDSLMQYCALGPYEPTELVLDQFDPVRTTWEADWNVVESLPTSENLQQTQNDRGFMPPRVCAAYRAPNEVTYFVCTDSSGVVVDTARWVDRAPRMSSLYVQQQERFKEMLMRWEPNVIAVAATGPSSVRLMANLQLIVREVVHKAMKTHIPVIWASAVVPAAFASSPGAEMEFSGKDAFFKTCVSVARFVRDPLVELCRLFDSKMTVLNLPLGLHALANHEKIFQRLCWEMSLWVGSCGLVLYDILKLSSPQDVLQFVPGLGRRRAAAIVQHLQGQPSFCRNELQEFMNHDVSPLVGKNCSPLLRIMPTADPSESYHLLDCTMIPPAWYPFAEMIAYTLIKGSFSRQLSLLRFLNEPLEKRRELVLTAIQENVNLFSTEASYIRDQPMGHDIYSSEVEFIVDELVNFGRSTMRRNFRLMTSQQLFQACTGTTYHPRNQGIHEKSNSDLCICEGDYIEGLVVDIRGGSVKGIRIKTTHGVAGFISIEDLPSQELKDQLTSCVSEMELAKENRLAGRTPKEFVIPAWLQKNASISGLVSSCNFDRCELRVRYMDHTQEYREDEEDSTSAFKMPDQSRTNDEIDTQSIRTVQLAERAIFSNVLKISQHILFRNVESMEDIRSLLSGKHVGECVMWPSAGERHAFLLSINVGPSSIVTYRVWEIRQANGQFAYSIKDNRTERKCEFSDADHLVEVFVKKIAASVNNFRSHRKFYPIQPQARASIEAQLNSRARFGYAFVEHHSPGSPAFYRVMYNRGKGLKALDVHFFFDKILVKQPKMKDGISGWALCHCAEDVSVFVKDLALRGNGS
jgi:hypothetical protein